MKLSPRSTVLAAAIVSAFTFGGWAAVGTAHGTLPPSSAAIGDAQPPKSIASSELNNALLPLVEMAPTRQKLVVVRGEMKLDYPYLQADVLQFEPGAKLIISKASQAIRPQTFLVVGKIVVRDPNNPGTITWERGGVPAAPSAPGEAPAGSSAVVDGSPGMPGRPGAPGVAGGDGQNAPGLTLVAMSVPSSGVLVDLIGGAGGQGSPGQKGGHGGNGAKGSPASSGFFDCKAGGGRGGAAGEGGRGGVGGDGGVGGAGGTFLLVSSARNLPSLTQKFRVLVAAGQSGQGGDRGAGGDAGLPGAGGQEARPYCGGGSAGAPANSGQVGELGSRPDSKREGDWTVADISADQYERYISPTAQMGLVEKLQWLLAKLTF